MSNKEEFSKNGLPVFLPCGCYGVRVKDKNGKRGAQVNELMLLPDGIRICKCGRKWKLSWVEVKWTS